jgi:DUF1680 family protein
MLDTFWAPRQKTVHEVSVPWATRHFDSSGGLDELKKNPAQYVAGTRVGDLEAIKFIEAMASVVGLQRDAAIEQLVDSWGKRLIEAQGADGYLTFGWPFGADPAQRWKAVWVSHEDYALGHYIEAAVAHRESTGHEALYQSAIRAANNMASVFLESERSYAPGHEEIEQALMRLYGVTGNRDYLNLCSWLIGQRGHHAGRSSYGRYSQDHIPVKDQRTIEGHAVRAAFLFNGVTEYVGATGDAAYHEAVLAIWDDLVENKLYLHGASGNESAKNEGYSTKTNYIPPEDTYGESCSVFGNFQWAHNLFRLTGDARYIDSAERMLYNAFYASLSLDGQHFFYRNAAEADEPTPRFEWHTVPCCPPNIVKLFSKVGGFFYETDTDGIFVKHYGSSEARIPWRGGVTVIQRTNFPWDGSIELRVEPKRPSRFALHLRFPSWSKKYTLAVNGSKIDASINAGWLTVKRAWKSGDVVELVLTMDIEQVTMPFRFPEYDGLVAFQRGPLVYCLEEHDVTRASPSQYFPDGIALMTQHRPDLLGGVTVLQGMAPSYDPLTSSETLTPFTLIPYGVWNNRKPGWMKIWLPSKKFSLNDFMNSPPPGESSAAC